MKLIKKANYKMFGKQVYLIGINIEGKKIFLESPVWSCEYYWNFGHIRTFTNNKQISRSKDFSSFSHFDNFEINNNILNDWHTLDACVLSQESLNELKTLMKLALNLGSEAKKFNSINYLKVINLMEYKNLTELHNKIISLLS